MQEILVCICQETKLLNCKIVGAKDLAADFNRAASGSRQFMR